MMTYCTASLGPVSVHGLSAFPPLSEANWILQPVSDCNRIICSPPRPITEMNPQVKNLLQIKTLMQN